METVTSGVIALCMFYQGGIIEHTYVKDQKMSTCLKMKRTVERSVNPQNVRMAVAKLMLCSRSLWVKQKSLKLSKRSIKQWLDDLANNTPNSGMFDPGDFKQDLKHHEKILDKKKNISTRLWKMP